MDGSKSGKVRLLTQMATSARNERMSDLLDKELLADAARDLLEMSRQCGYRIEMHADAVHEGEEFRSAIILVKHSGGIIWSKTVKPS